MDTQLYLHDFVHALEQTFPDRIWFCGLQGSRTRGEHRDDSDFDMVVILDTIEFGDMQAYRQMVQTLPGADLSCGFFSAVHDIMAWDPSDLFHLCMDTQAIIGSLDSVWERVNRSDIMHAIWRGSCDIYHGCVHNMIHDRSEPVLQHLLKQAVFVIQQSIYLLDGTLTLTLPHTMEYADAAQYEVLSLAAAAREGAHLEFESSSESLFVWAQKTIGKCSAYAD